MDFARRHDTPCPSPRSALPTDRNLFHSSYRAASSRSVAEPPTDSAHAIAESSAGHPVDVEITSRRDPVAVDGTNGAGGAPHAPNRVGPSTASTRGLVDNRFVGMKSRGVRTTGRHILTVARGASNRSPSTASAAPARSLVPRYRLSTTLLVPPEAQALQTHGRVPRDVTHGAPSSQGNVPVAGRRSPPSPNRTDFATSSRHRLRQREPEGFTTSTRCA